MTPDPRLDSHNLGPDTNVRQLTADESARLLAGLPRSADPLQLEEDELVERRRGALDRRPRRHLRPIHALLAGLLGIALGFFIAHATLAASRAAHQQGSPSPATPSSTVGSVAGAQLETPRGTGASPTPAAIVDPIGAWPTPSGASAPGSIEQPRPELVVVTPRPVVLAPPTSGAVGPASWYDDPRKAGMYAAAGPALRVGDWRGRTVTVCASTCFAVVLSDYCGCPGGRVIDLSSTAFSRLAPLTQGVVRVTVTW